MLSSRSFFPLAVLAAMLLASDGVRTIARQETFRSAIDTVAIYATVRGPDGRLLPHLGRSDFRLFEDDIPVDIALFSTEPPPLNVVVLVDTSFSVMGLGPPSARRHVRDAVLAFAAALAPSDRIRLGSFGLEIALGAHLTHDVVELARVLDEEMWAGGGTPLWQALIAGVTSVAREPARRVVLVVTDGVDTGRLPGLPGGRARVETLARESETTIYAVYLSSGRTLAAEMRNVADETGGGHVVIRETDNLQVALATVADELRHQYLVGFVPRARDGAVHRVELRVATPGATVRARSTFLAAAAR